jgi:outer membrane protein assembly factor BamB
MFRPAALLAVLLVAAAARGQAPAEPAVLRGDSPQTRKRLAEAEAKLVAGKAADAADDLQRVLDEAGDDLVSTDGKQFRPARLVAHGLLARLPADALAAYQARVEAPAKQLLDAGKKDRDPRPLWQLLDRYFVSRPAQEGGRLLGDLLFERGEFRAAELVWRRLLPDGGADLAHPTPPADPAAVAARVVLAAIFAHEPDRAKAEWEAFAAKYPTAAGTFAGKDGPYKDTLTALLDKPPQLPAEAPSREWPTFGGGPDRSGRVPGPVPHHWPARPTWRKTLYDSDREPRAGAVAPFGLKQPLGHPVVADGAVAVPIGDAVLRFDLRTGAVLPGTKRPATAEAAGTLSAFAGRVFARVGAAAVKPPEAKEVGAALAAVGPSRTAWELKPPAAGEDRGPAAWEGAPLIADGRLFAAFARFDGGRVAHGVVCYDPADAATAPDRAAWLAEASDSPLSGGGEGRFRQELVTRAGRNVVLATNAGAVVAFDALTGKRAWGFAYPRTARRAAQAARSADPAPAAAHGGRVFVAPADADRVFALDAETGRLLWESTPLEGTQIIGVTSGRVVVHVNGPSRGLRGLSVVTGSHRDPDGWTQQTDPQLLGYGRGFVTDDAVFWPSRGGGLFILAGDSGRPVGRFFPPGGQGGLFGNLAYADGVLVVVTPTEVSGYVAEPQRLPAPRPGSEPGPWVASVLDAAESKLAAGDTAGARNLLLGAARADVPASLRARAAARLVLLTPPGAGEASYPTDLKSVLGANVRSEWLLSGDGQLLTLGGLIDRHAGRAAPARPPPAEGAQRRDEPPSLGPNTRVDRTVAFPPATFPLLSVAGADGPVAHLFAATPEHVIAVPVAGGEPRRVAAADQITHAADLGAGFVAAGPFAVAVYGAGREPEWVFRVPDPEPLPDSPGGVPFRTGDPPPRPMLSSFTLAGNWLLARLGEHHLVGLDLAGRRVGWVLGGHGRAGYEPLLLPGVPSFGPHLYAAGPVAAVQLSDGRRWFVNVATGRVCDHGGKSLAGSVPTGHGERTAGAWWAAPPAGVKGGRIACSDGPGLVNLVSPELDKTLWTHELSGESSLSGEPPQARLLAGRVYVLSRRNHGCELEQLVPQDASPVWTEPAFLDAGRLDIAALDADADRVYAPAGGKLTALDVGDGSVMWTAALPKLHGAAGWRVRAGPKAVIAYPAEAVPAEPQADVWGRAGRSFARAPLAWRLLPLGETLAETWAERTVPVLLFDPQTGEELKRLTLPARGPQVAARFAGDAAVVLTGAGATWLR